MRSPPQQFFFSNSCPLVFLFSSQQPHAPPTTSPSSVRRASTSPPLRARLLFGQVLCLSFSSRHRAAPLAEAPSITLIRTSKCCLTSSRHNTSAVHETPESRSGKTKKGGSTCSCFHSVHAAGGQHGGGQVQLCGAGHEGAVAARRRHRQDLQQDRRRPGMVERRGQRACE